MKTKLGLLLAAAIFLAVAPMTPAFAAVKFRGIAGSYVASNGHLGGGAQTFSTWTIELWIRPATTAVGQGLFDIHGDWKQTTISLEKDGGIGCLTMWPSVYYGTYSDPNVITVNEWQLLGFVSDGQSLSIYRNGIKIASGIVSPQIFISGEAAGSVSGTFNFGFSDYQTLPDGNYFSGALSDFRVWDRALTPSELASHVQSHPAPTAPGLKNVIPFDEGTGTTFYDGVGGVTGSYYNVDFVPGPLPAKPSLTNGLVAHYPFNGNANDASGMANNGTANGSVLTADRLGQGGNAYSFNGAGAFVSAPNQSYLTFPDGGDFTISVWAAANGNPGSSSYHQWFMCGMDNGSGMRPKWMLAYGPLNSASWPQDVNTFSFHTVDTSGGDSYWLATSVFNPPMGSWHHYVVSKSGSSYLAYIDGLPTSGTNYSLHTGTPVPVATPPSAIPSGITAPFTMGWAEGGGYFNGGLDDIRIYSRALSVSEVRQLYEHESGPRVNLIKSVKPSFSNLFIGTNYQLQVSNDMIAWTNEGSSFTATNTAMIHPQYWDVENWNRLFFRLQVSP